MRLARNRSPILLSAGKFDLIEGTGYSGAPFGSLSGKDPLWFHCIGVANGFVWYFTVNDA